MGFLFPPSPPDVVVPAAPTQADITAENAKASDAQSASLTRYLAQQSGLGANQLKGSSIDEQKTGLKP